jgi:hypothetical protein
MEHESRRAGMPDGLPNDFRRHVFSPAGTLVGLLRWRSGKAGVRSETRAEGEKGQQRAAHGELAKELSGKRRSALSKLCYITPL